LQAAYGKLKEFFDLPMEQKLNYRINELSLGYVPPKSTVYVSSKINKNTKKDLNETLILALERDADHPLVKARTRFIGPNPWPQEIDGLRETLVRYQKAIVEFGRKLLPIYAVALDQPADFFDPYYKDPVVWSRNAHYPAVEAEENQFGIAPHSDHSCLTLLPIAEVPGLQVLTPAGDWIDAKYVEGGIIVNTGEFLNRWSNGRFLPTPHRVIPPTRDRYSIATFFNPDASTVAKPMDSCVSADNPAKFDPVKLIDYLAWYIDTNYQRSASGKQG
jgi:isopenicillin N synthase-like dioxygenase